jgi:hypothetical protein
MGDTRLADATQMRGVVVLARTPRKTEEIARGYADPYGIFYVTFCNSTLGDKRVARHNERLLTHERVASFNKARQPLDVEGENAILRGQPTCKAHG